MQTRGLVAALVLVVTEACDRPNAIPVASRGANPIVSSDGRIHAHEMNAKGWAPVLFKEPIQGRKVGEMCTWPSSGELGQKHKGLVYTIGEFDPVTCAGTMYFGDWKADLKRAEDAAKARGGWRVDTAAATRRRP